MKKFIFLFLLVNTFPFFAQPYVLIPDPYFLAFLKSKIPQAVIGNSLNISSTLVTTTTRSLDVRSWNISNLSGIQHFSSLTHLDCSYNCPSSTFPCNAQVNTLPPLPDSLQFFYCSGNALQSLPTLPSGLIELYCRNNQLTSLPPLPNSLKNLDCYGNSLSDLPPIPSSLRYLNCSFNSLTRIPPLPNSLQFFYCRFNKIRCFNNLPDSIHRPEPPGCTSCQYFMDLSLNPFQCLPNYVTTMDPILFSFPLCTAGSGTDCSMASGIKDNAIEFSERSIYPNPASSHFIIDIPNNDTQTLQILDVNGRLIRNQELKEKTEVDISGLSDGVYTLFIKSQKNTFTKKLIVVK